MFIFGNVLSGIAEVLDVILNIYMWIIIVRALISWVNPDPYNPIVRILTQVTEPVLRPIRKLVPPHRVGLDFSPLIAALIIIFLRSALIKTLYRIAATMN
jgi:YggT family protein